MSEIVREQFNNRIEYIVSILGFAAGFGSIWRFPYMIFANGGGVFLIPYLIFLFIIGIPAFYFETSLGQLFQRGPPDCFYIVDKKYKGLGILPVFLAFTLSTYYNTILAYSFYFLLMSFKYPLPWQQNDVQKYQQPWNKDYFYNNVLQISSGLGDNGNIVWPLFISYLFSQFVVFLCIQKGVKVSGKIALFTSVGPFVFLFLFLLRGLFLKGSLIGLKYLLYPEWSKLFHLQVWIDAANQVLWQISVGAGVLIYFGSYRDKKEEVIRTAFIVPLLTVFCGFLSAFAIFTYMGYMSEITGIPIQNIPLGGPDLVFVVFPSVFSLMKMSNLFSLVFFFIMVLLGIDTQFACVDCLAGFIQDEYLDGKESIDYKGMEITIRMIRGLLCIFIALFGFLYCCQGGFYYISFVDGFSCGINFFWAVFFEVYYFNWYVKKEHINNQIEIMAKQKIPLYFKYCIQYIIPVITCLLGCLAILLKIWDSYFYGWKLSFIGWILTLFPYILIYYYYQKYQNCNKNMEYFEEDINERNIQLQKLIQ